MRSDNRKKKKTGVKPVVILAALILTAVILAALLFFRSGRLPFLGYVGIDVSGAISESFREAAADGSDTLIDALNAAGNGEITLSDIGFDSIFEGTVILGDSVTEGISGYGYLSEDKVFCRVGGSVLNSSDEIPKAAATNPEIAFFSFGSNEMGMFSGDADYFTQKYEEFIRSFMELSPDTEIYVNSIPKPSDSRINGGGYFYLWEDFNAAILQMCGRLGAEYIDNTSILTEHPELYAGDGIHVNPDYYIYWLTDMMNEADLIGR